MLLSCGLIDLLLDDFGHLLKLVIDEIFDSNLGLAKLSLETLNLLGDRRTDLVVDASNGLLGDEEAGVRIKTIVKDPLELVLQDDNLVDLLSVARGNLIGIDLAECLASQRNKSVEHHDNIDNGREEEDEPLVVFVVTYLIGKLSQRGQVRHLDSADVRLKVGLVNV